MNDEQSNQSILLDVYQRLGGIEAKIDDVKSIRITADNAQTTAYRAEQKSENNAKDIEEIRKDIVDSRKESEANKRWLIGMAVTTALTIVGLIASFLQL